MFSSLDLVRFCVTSHTWNNFFIEKETHIKGFLITIDQDIFNYTMISNYLKLPCSLNNSNKSNNNNNIQIILNAPKFNFLYMHKKYCVGQNK